MAIKNFKIKFARVKNITAETSIENHIYHYTKPHEMVICDTDGVTGDRISHQQEKYFFF
jgi:hypothetical protein